MKLNSIFFALFYSVCLAAAQPSEQISDTSQPAIKEPAPQPIEIAPEPPAPPEGTLTLQVDGIRKLKGNLRVRIYNSEESFPSKDEAMMFLLREVPVNAETATIVLDKLPYGRYGVVVHHDWDADGKVDKTWYHAPKEPIACSNDAKGNFGPPNWEDAVLDLNQPKLDLPIHFGK